MVSKIKNLKDLMNNITVYSSRDSYYWDDDDDEDNNDLEFSEEEIGYDSRAKDYSFSGDGTKVFMMWETQETPDFDAIMDEFLRTVKANCDYYKIPYPTEYWASICERSYAYTGNFRILKSTDGKTFEYLGRDNPIYNQKAIDDFLEEALPKRSLFGPSVFHITLVVYGEADKSLCFRIYQDEPSSDDIEGYGDTYEEALKDLENNLDYLSRYWDCDRGYVYGERVIDYYDDVLEDIELKYDKPIKYLTPEEFAQALFDDKNDYYPIKDWTEEDWERVADAIDCHDNEILYDLGEIDELEVLAPIDWDPRY